MVWQGVESSAEVTLSGVKVTVRVRLKEDLHRGARCRCFFSVLTLDVPGDLR